MVKTLEEIVGKVKSQPMKTAAKQPQDEPVLEAIRDAKKWYCRGYNWLGIRKR